MSLRYAILFVALVPSTVIAEDVKSRYTKYEYLIPMRDGKRLFTAVYVPKDALGDGTIREGQTYPILLNRTPYSVRPYGVDQYRSSLGPSPLFEKSGYVFVYQDVRGRWMSEGEFVNMRPHNPNKGPNDVDESTDTYDTIEFLLKNVKGHNGRVGQYGISYPGFYTAAGMIDAHPALKVASPQAPVTDWFIGDDFHHNGAFFLKHAFNFLANFDRPRPKPTTKSAERFDHGTPDGYDYFLKLGTLSEVNDKLFDGRASFWNEMMRHGNYDDFWKARNIRQHLKDVKPIVLTVGGWYDAENLFGALEVYKHVKELSPKTQNHLVMGPWVHGGWASGGGDKLGDVSFNAQTAEFYREKIEFPFFELYLKQKGVIRAKGRPAFPNVWAFETGTNVWRTHDVWPPAEVKPRAIYLQANGKLDYKMPEATPADNGYDEYVSDPAKPVPYFDKIVLGMSREYKTADQRFAARRPDVLVYQTEVLEEDLTVAGPIPIELFVSTTGTDSDWVVKLIDVYPDDFPNPTPNPAAVKMGGYQQLVRGDVMRGKFRDSFEKPSPLQPGKPTSVNFTMPDVYHVFRRGHRVMIQVQSSWFPLVDRNPQKFMDVYSAIPEDFQKATQRVYRAPKMASRVLLPVMP